MNTRERVHEYDFRPRVDESTNDKVRRIAAMRDIPPNVLLREWILEGVRKNEFILSPADNDASFHRVSRAHG